MLVIYLFQNILLFGIIFVRNATCLRTYSADYIIKLREEVRAMFQHAYDGYLRHASDFDELRPLTCDGVDTWGSYSLTLIDALDTLATMGNYSEFQRVANLLTEKMNFDRDINVSVFETNIRIVGGLISAHLMSRKAGLELEPSWPCNGPLLRMAEDVARRLLPAFNTNTGMPYGTVNLLYGVPSGETSVTCTAGVGTFIVEFGALSRLTGDPIYEEVALNAIYSLWNYRSPIGLLGNHIDVQTGRWTAQDSGIGAGVDSFFEYLVKGAIMLNRPDLLEMFHEGRMAIDKYLKRDDWYVWAGMNKGQVTLPVFQSLEAYWPGVLSLLGDIAPAMRILYNYHTVWKQYGFLPEFYNIPGAEAGANRENYPLRPELVESAMYLYRMTKDPFLLEVGENMLRSIQYSAKTSCGYATIRNVRDHSKENRMESFFLAETTKYLYMLFDEANFLHNDGREGEILQTPNGQCVINAGGYIFNTEAHPVDMSALHCCYDLPREDIFADFNLDDFHGDKLGRQERRKHDTDVEKSNKFDCVTAKENPLKSVDSNITIDIEVVDEKDTAAAQALFENVQQIQNERNTNTKEPLDTTVGEGHVTPINLHQLLKETKDNFSKNEVLLEFIIVLMQNHTMDPMVIKKLNLFNESVDSFDVKDDSKTKTLWDLYQLKHYHDIKGRLIEKLRLQKLDKANAKSDMLKHLSEAKDSYRISLVNTTAMQQFINTLNRKIHPEQKKDLLSTPFLSEEEIVELDTKRQLPGPSEFFEKLRLIAENKMRTSKRSQKWQPLMEEIKTQTKAIHTLFHSITLADSKDKENDDQIGNVSQLSKESAESEAAKKHFTPPSLDDDATKNASILSQFVQSIIKSTTPRQRSNFDAQLFLEKIRGVHNFSDFTQNYEVLTCRAPPFRHRFSFRHAFP